jgi:hypothetical protein
VKQSRRRRKGEIEKEEREDFGTYQSTVTADVSVPATIIVHEIMPIAGGVKGKMNDA